MYYSLQLCYEKPFIACHIKLYQPLRYIYSPFKAVVEVFIDLLKVSNSLKKLLNLASIFDFYLK